jgi:MFS family permease
MLLAGLVMAISGHYVIYALGYAALMAFDGIFNVYIRTLRSQIIPKEHLGKTTGFIALLNMFSIPLSGLMVMLLSSHFNPTEIIGVVFILAISCGIGLVLFGRKIFRYETWLPSIQREESVQMAAPAAD